MFFHAVPAFNVHGLCYFMLDLTYMSCIILCYI